MNGSKVSIPHVGGVCFQCVIGIFRHFISSHAQRIPREFIAIDLE